MIQKPYKAFEVSIMLILYFFRKFRKFIHLQGGPKTDNQFYFGDNFGNSAPILTILSPLLAKMYGA